MEQKKERVVIFIDGRNFYHSSKPLERKGFEINLGRLVGDLVGSRELITVYYYNALLDKEHDLKRYEEHNKYLDSLRKIPKFKVVLCDWRKIIEKNGNVRYDIKGDDVYLAHDLLIGAFDNLYDIAIIISGDADFIPVINTLRNRFKKKVGNGFFRRTSSYKLRKTCDFSVNLNKVLIKINQKNNRTEASVPSEDGTSQV